MGFAYLRFVITVVAPGICADRARPAVSDGTPGDLAREIAA